MVRASIAWAMDKLDGMPLHCQTNEQRLLHATKTLDARSGCTAVAKAMFIQIGAAGDANITIVLGRNLKTAVLELGIVGMMRL